jgi:methyltransferase (TIGR00027 family)
MESELADVSLTAIGVALLRAMESRRPDRLFDDPYAQAFVDAAPPDYRTRLPWTDTASNQLGAALAVSIPVRTRFFDTYLVDACAAGCRQVVLLAAGLDARAYRLDWPPGVRLFELDLPGVLAFKDRVLAQRQPACERIAIPVDLRDDWPRPLRAAGFDPAAPTAWLIEGLLIYLSKKDAARLLATVTELSAPGSQVSFEQGLASFSQKALRHIRGTGQLAHVTSLWKGGLSEPAGPWLTRRGWRTHSVDRVALTESYGRSFVGRTGGEFLTATRT